MLEARRTPPEPPSLKVLDHPENVFPYLRIHEGASARGNATLYSATHTGTGQELRVCVRPKSSTPVPPLRHRAWERTFDYDSDERNDFLVIAEPSGRLLAEVLKDPTTEDHRRLELLAELADSLSDLNEAGIPPTRMTYEDCRVDDKGRLRLDPMGLSRNDVELSFEEWLPSLLGGSLAEPGPVDVRVTVDRVVLTENGREVATYLRPEEMVELEQEPLTVKATRRVSKRRRRRRLRSRTSPLGVMLLATLGVGGALAFREYGAWSHYLPTADPFAAKMALVTGWAFLTGIVFGRKPWQKTFVRA